MLGQALHKVLLTHHHPEASQARAPAASSELVRSSRLRFFGQLSSDGAALRGASHRRQQQTMAAVHASSSVTPEAMPAMVLHARGCVLTLTGAEAAAQQPTSGSCAYIARLITTPQQLVSTSGMPAKATQVHAITDAEAA